MLSNQNKIRIIGGKWRTRSITFSNSTGLRPTPNRVRETVFNWLGQDLTGRHVLICLRVAEQWGLRPRLGGLNR